MSWPFAERPADRLRRREDRGQVRVLRRCDGRRDAHEDRVGGGEVRTVGQQHPQPASEGGGQAVVRDVVDRGGAGVELLDPAGVRVDALDLRPASTNEMARGRPT